MAADDSARQPARRPAGRPKGPARPPASPARPWGRPVRTETVRWASTLAAARMAMGITLAELADRTGIAVSHLSRLKAGVIVRPSAELVGRLVAGYGLPGARVRSAIAGAPAAVEWPRGRAEWYREQAAEQERIALELVGARPRRGNRDDDIGIKAGSSRFESS